MSLFIAKNEKLIEEDRLNANSNSVNKSEMVALIVKSNIKCYGCGNLGHMEKDLFQKGKQTKGIVCYNYKIAGHIEKITEIKRKATNHL